jgi:hypothetical protein
MHKIMRCFNQLSGSGSSRSCVGDRVHTVGNRLFGGVAVVSPDTETFVIRLPEFTERLLSSAQMSRHFWGDLWRMI